MGRRVRTLFPLRRGAGQRDRRATGSRRIKASRLQLRTGFSPPGLSLRLRRAKSTSILRSTRFWSIDREKRDWSTWSSRQGMGKSTILGNLLRISSNVLRSWSSSTKRRDCLYLVCRFRLNLIVGVVCHCEQSRDSYTLCDVYTRCHFVRVEEIRCTEGDLEPRSYWK